VRPARVTSGFTESRMSECEVTVGDKRRRVCSLLDFHSQTMQAWPELEICGLADSLMGTGELGLLAWSDRVVSA
jgi:hypothetical protein